MKNNNKRKFDIVKFVWLVIILTIVICVISNIANNLVKNSTNTMVIKNGKVSREETVTGYVVRNETIIKNENHENGMEKIVTEGQKVAKGDSVYRYYSSGEDEKKKKIIELNQQIEEAIKNSPDILLPQDTKLLDSQIEEKLLKISALNNMQQIKEYKKSISEYLEKKAKIAGELSPSGSHIRELINERNTYQKELEENSEYVNATESGLLSYRIDGLEETLKISEVSTFNEEYLNNLNLKAGQVISLSDQQGKMVDNFECYIICVMDSEEAKNAKLGDNVTIALPSAREINAKIYNIINEENGKNTITFKFKEGIDELLNYRKLNLDIIWWSAKGFKVPNSALVEINNLKYVIRTRNGYLTKVLVKVKKTTNDYSIISNYSSSEIDELNIEKNARTSLLLYDNILAKPTQNDIDSTR